jgi:hypothetical protein
MLSMSSGPPLRLPYIAIYSVGPRKRDEREGEERARGKGRVGVRPPRQKFLDPPLDDSAEVMSGHDVMKL